MQIMPSISKASAVWFGIIFAIGIFALTHNKDIFTKTTDPEKVGETQASKDQQKTKQNIKMSHLT